MNLFTLLPCDVKSDQHSSLWVMTVSGYNLAAKLIKVFASTIILNTLFCQIEAEPTAGPLLLCPGVHKLTCQGDVGYVRSGEHTIHWAQVNKNVDMHTNESGVLDHTRDMQFQPGCSIIVSNIHSLD